MEISEILKRLSDGPAREWQIVEQTRAEVETLKHGLPVVCTLRASALRNRHWMQIQEIIKKYLVCIHFNLKFQQSILKGL